MKKSPRPAQRTLPGFWICAGLGLALRLLYIFFTRNDAPHPDLGTFVQSALSLTHPFDTSPREPFSVWWLWLLSKVHITSTLGIRFATAFWFLPCLGLLFSLAKRFLGERGAWGSIILYSVLPAQVKLDALGMRHILESCGLLLLLNALTQDAGLAKARSFRQAALAYAALVLTRISYLNSGFLILAHGAWRGKSFRPFLALLPGLFLLLPHLYDNKTTFGDPLHTINWPTYWFSNLEYVGQPGFPATREEWEKDPAKPRLTFRQWAFEKHTPLEFVKETVKGFFLCLGVFYHRVYFSFGLPRIVQWVLLGLYFLGFGAAWFYARWRVLALAFCFLVLPYAFVMHVFWAGRFFAPYTPLAILFLMLGAQELVKGFLKLQGRTPPPEFLPLLAGR